MTKRSGVYGATLSEADTVVLLEKDRNGQLILVCCRIKFCVSLFSLDF